MTDKEQIARAKRVADEIRPFWPEKAAEIDKAIAEAEAGQRDGLKVDVGIKYRVAKYEGEYAPNKTPIEVIEGEG